MPTHLSSSNGVMMKSLLIVLQCLVSSCYLLSILVLVSSDVIGNCGRKELFYRIHTICLRHLYLSFQRENEPNCLKGYNTKFLNCTNHEIRNCYGSNSKTNNSTVERFQNYFKLANVTELYCDYAGLPTDSPLPTCTDVTVVMVYYLCRDTFSKDFRKNRSDTTLCSKYDDFLKCFTGTSTKYCSRSYDEYIRNQRSIYLENANPFCEQRTSDAAATTALNPLKGAIGIIFTISLFLVSYAS